MILRIRGGNSGIIEYLISGQKQENYFFRDELDRRLILSGNLNITDKVINSIPNRSQERYYHITISFKEDDIDEKMLSDVVDEFESLFMCSYKSDEYNFYAEAHLPKIKQVLDKKTDKFIYRKPHIHIVIPRINLLTGTKLNTLGLTNRNIKELDSIQEYINNKFNLESPKDFIRKDHSYEYANILSRVKGDFFGDKNGQIKQNLAEKIYTNKINNREDLENELGKIGEFKIRNQGKINEYYAIKIGDDKKFTNLKSSVFSLIYIENKMFPNLKPEKKDIDINLDKWKKITSRENKYIIPNSKNIREEYYKLSSNEEKIIFLNKKTQEFYQKYELKDISDKDIKIHTDIEKKDLTTQKFLLSDKNSLITALKQKEVNVQEINTKNITLKNVIKTLSNTYFIDENKYQTTDKYIIYNNKRYTINELLDKHIHLNIQEKIYFIDYSKDYVQIPQKEAYKKIISKKERLNIQNIYKKACYNYRKLLRDANKEFVLSLNAVISEIKNKNKNILLNQEITVLILKKLQALEVAEIYKNTFCNKNNSFITLQNKGENSMAIDFNNEDYENGIKNPKIFQFFAKKIKERERFIKWFLENQEKFLKADLKIEKYKNGDVGYRNINNPELEVMVDKGDRILFNNKTDITPAKIKVMLELAQNKYGDVLEIFGNKDFKQKVIEVIAKEKMDIIPKNKKLLKELQNYKQVIKFQEQEKNKEQEKGMQGDTNSSIVGNDFKYKKLIETGQTINHKNEKTFYIKLRDITGKEEVLFGSGLSKAISNLGIKIGDFISPTKEGKKEFTVEVPIKNEKGEDIGTKQEKRYMNEWAIDKLDKNKYYEISFYKNGQKINIQLYENENKEVKCIINNIDIEKVDINERKPYIQKLENQPEINKFFTTEQLNELAEKGKSTSIVIEKNIISYEEKITQERQQEQEQEQEQEM